MEFKDLRYIHNLIFTEKHGGLERSTFTFFLFFQEISDFRDDERQPATIAPTLQLDITSNDD